MKRYLMFPAFLLAMILFALVACGGGDAAPPTAAPLAQATADPIEQSVSQTVAAIAVAQTVAALTGGETPAAAPPTATTAPADSQPTTASVTLEPTAAPTAEPSPTTVAAEPPTLEPALCATLTAVNVRSGPGTAYEPPVGTLAANTELAPLSYVARGFPQGEWLEVQIPATGRIVWVTAGPQFVRCSVAVTSLPAPASIAPTPRPTATPTPIPATATPTRVVAGLPPNVTNDVPGGACQRTDHIKTRIETDPNFLYRVYARDDRAGPNDGDGIDLVRFTIFDSFGTLYQREERVAGYCIFRGGEPNCNTWPFNEQGRYTWGEGGSQVSSGTYQVFIEVVSDQPDPSSDSNVCNWNFDMAVTVP